MRERFNILVHYYRTIPNAGEGKYLDMFLIVWQYFHIFKLLMEHQIIVIVQSMHLTIFLTFLNK